MRYVVRRSVLGTGVTIQKVDGYEVVSSIDVPWDDVGEILSKVGSLLIGHRMIENVEKDAQQALDQTNRGQEG